MDPAESKATFARRVTETLLERGAITAMPNGNNRVVHLYVLRVDKRKWFFVSVIKQNDDDRNLAEFSISIQVTSRKIFEALNWCVMVSLFEEWHKGT